MFFDLFQPIKSSHLFYPSSFV